MIVIHGPMACGKTRHKQALAAKYERRIVCDDWTGSDAPPPTDCLVLTYESAEVIGKRLPGAMIIPFDVAMQGIAANRDSYPRYARDVVPGARLRAPYGGWPCWTGPL